MKRDLQVFYDDILESIEKIESYLKDIPEDIFLQNIQLQDAIIRRMEIIGEAVKNIPNEVKEKITAIPWRKIQAMRNILIHEYFGVNMKSLLLTIKNDLPMLKEEINKLISQIA